MSSNAYAIEAAGVSAGIVIHERGGFRFYAANESFTSMDGQIFKRPRDAEKAAEKLVADRPADRLRLAV